MNPQRRLLPPPPRGFTLVELMVSVSIIGLIMLVLLGMTNQISATWRSTTGKIEEFQQARNGFESMTRKLSQATLATFMDFQFVTGAGGIQTPVAFRRNSELRFACGPMSAGTGSFVGLAPTPPSGHTYTTHGVFFQAPFGYVDEPGVQDMTNLLNTWGFFIDVANDSTTNPPFLAKLSTPWPDRYGYRLTEFQQSTEKMSVYNLDINRHDVAQYPPPQGTSLSGPVTTELSWFLSDLTGSNGSTPPTRVLAENVVALIIWPKLAKQDEDYRRSQGWSTVSPYYIYDSSMSVNGMFTTLGTTSLNYGAGIVGGTVAEVGGIDPKNQLPPVVQVTMVALDAASAHRLLDPAGNLLVSVNAFTQGLFVQALNPPYPSPQPGTPTQYDLDMKQLEANLINPSTIAPVLGVGALKYRIFTTNVSIRGAKWSSYEVQ